MIRSRVCGRTQQFVVEGVVPFRKVQVAGDDRWSPFVALRDDVVEVLVLPGCQRNSKSDPPLPIFGNLNLTRPNYSSACMTGIC